MCSEHNGDRMKLENKTAQERDKSNCDRQPCQSQKLLRAGQYEHVNDNQFQRQGQSEGQSKSTGVWYLSNRVSFQSHRCAVKNSNYWQKRKIRYSIGPPATLVPSLATREKLVGTDKKNSEEGLLTDVRL